MTITTWLASAVILLLFLLCGLWFNFKKRETRYEERIAEIEREALKSLSRVEENLNGENSAREGC
ncbi:hypothetical protein [Rossellomorea aquimaris]|jgi:hypothetical protein|uniref:Uncharacterized protein n=1 Tax=Rossellomorea aquimaris TaxID=189382 RepID=A0A1J6WGE4_9BACI|nr:hypothetical protein [Rossellomorea aquimaris]OIU70952.1 hypothetical protein BHE18_20865 [Rossellomorea aquimaris]